MRCHFLNQIEKNELGIACRPMAPHLLGGADSIGLTDDRSLINRTGQGKFSGAAG
jgi:hypothetical protein